MDAGRVTRSHTGRRELPPVLHRHESTERRFVAEVDGYVAGWVKVQVTTTLLSNAHALEIGGLAVDPARQGIGIGQRLVEAAVQECGRRGARKVTLRVLGPNTAARRLYDRCGFQIEGVLREEFLLDGHYVDDVLMACQLAPPVP